MFSKFCLVFLVFGSSAVQSQIVCPQAITFALGSKGTLPSSTATGLVSVPVNFNCTYQFVIPKQYALKLLISTNYNYQIDTITYTDNLGMKVRLGTPVSNIQQWAVQPNAYLTVINRSNTTRFYLTYEYVNLNNFQQRKQYTGTHRTLAFNKNTYYTFSSFANDHVALNLAQKSSNFNFVATNYFLFDGNDITNSRMIGKLSQFGARTIYSSYNSISIVNFYGSTDNSVILANDRSTIRDYGSYNVILVGPGLPFTSRLADLSPNGGLYTFICDQCSNLYIKKLSFDSSLSPPKGHVDIRPLSPTYRGLTILRYGVSTETSKLFPQLIPTEMFTLAINNSIFNISIDSTSSAAWLQPFDGRKGTIFSPRLWDPNAIPAFNYNFSSTNQTYSFGVNFKQHAFSDNSEILFIKIGSTNDNVAFNQAYTKQSNSFSSVSARGNYMKTVFTSGVTSNISLEFQMSVKSSSITSISNFFSVFVITSLIFKMI